MFFEISQYSQESTCSCPCWSFFTKHLWWLLLDFRSSKYFFSAESGIFCWQSLLFLPRTLLKTRVKAQKLPIELFCKKGAPRSFASFTGKKLCWSLLLTELQVFRLAALLKRDWTHMFSYGIYKSFKNTLFEVWERLVPKLVLSPGLLCSNYCNNCQYSVCCYWYCYNQKQLSGTILQKGCSDKFR